jgi:hypothetical protein
MNDVLINSFEIERNKEGNIVRYRDGEMSLTWKNCPKCRRHLFSQRDRCLWNDCNWNIKKREVLGSLMLVGSMSFVDLFYELEKHLTFMGFTVFMPYIDGMRNKKVYLTMKGAWEYLQLHMFNKLDKVDYIFIVNDKMDISDKFGYIGKSTTEEILYTLMTKLKEGEDRMDWYKYINSLYPLPWDDIFSQKTIDRVIQTLKEYGVDMDRIHL